LENGLSASPFVWRVRYALARKGLTFESMPLGFTDIPKVSYTPINDSHYAGCFAFFGTHRGNRGPFR
jgi:hypothetical protein